MTMENDEIKRLLQQLPKASMIPTPAGFVAVPCSRVESAGGDLAQAREWVSSAGGVEEKSEVRRSADLRSGRLVALSPRVGRYFAIPSDALA